MRRWPIAVDIGTSSIRMMQLGRNAGRVEVVACAQRHLGEAAQDDPQEYRRQVIETVRELHRSHAFKGRRAITSLSCSQIELRSIRVPHMPERELREAVKWEASERLGFDVTPDRLGYLHAGQVRQGAETQDEVILVGVRPETIQEHLAIAGEIGLFVEHVDFEPLAVFRVFERYLRRRGDESNVSVVVDIGNSSTRVIVARGRQVVFIKSIDIGGRMLTEAVSRSLNLSFKEAHDLRMLIMRDEPRPGGETVSDNVNWTLHDALRAQAEALGREIALCLRYCAVTFRGLRADKVHVVGGQAYDPALLSLLGQHLNVECVVGEPLRGIDVSRGSFAGNRRGSLVEWAACAGMAMRDQKILEPLEEGDHERSRLSA
jgi:type IV pilus assembly protein PilM